MSGIALILALAAALIAGIAIGLTYAEIKHLRGRIAALESAQAKHLPYRTAEEIEDGIGALIPILYEEELTHERIQNALIHFQRARSGKAK
jgi:hypothetical protein